MDMAAEVHHRGVRRVGGHAWFAGSLDPRTRLKNLPIPGFYGSSRISGRSGNLVVYQMRSSIGALEETQRSLRTLGLRGVFSASLRVGNETTWGLIRSAQDYISVLILDEIYYKEDQPSSDTTSLQYEHVKFGTETQPGSLYRNSNGEYFVFEADRKKLLLNWSTSDNFESALLKFRQAFNPETSRVHQSVLAITTRDVLQETSSVDVLDGPTSALLAQADEAGFANVAFARLAYDDVQLTWRRPYARFSDRSTRFGELGLLGTGLDLALSKAFALESGPVGILTEAGIEISVRRDDGKQRTAPF